MAVSLIIVHNIQEQWQQKAIALFQREIFSLMIQGWLLHPSTDNMYPM